MLAGAGSCLVCVVIVLLWLASVGVFGVQRVAEDGLAAFDGFI